MGILGAIGSGLWNTAKWSAIGIGKASWSLGKSAGENIAHYGPKFAAYTGEMEWKGIKGVGKTLYNTSNNPNWDNPLSYAHAAGNFVSGLVKKVDGEVIKDSAGKVIKETSDRYRLSRSGKFVFGAGMALYGVNDSMGTLEDSRMGMADDGPITTATPRFPVDNGGATGDLVFAMNRNRRG